MDVFGDAFTELSLQAFTEAYLSLCTILISPLFTSVTVSPSKGSANPQSYTSASMVLSISWRHTCPFAVRVISVFTFTPGTLHLRTMPFPVMEYSFAPLHTYIYPSWTMAMVESGAASSRDSPLRATENGKSEEYTNLSYCYPSLSSHCSWYSW